MGCCNEVGSDQDAAVDVQPSPNIAGNPDQGTGRQDAPQVGLHCLSTSGWRAIYDRFGTVRLLAHSRGIHREAEHDDSEDGYVRRTVVVQNPMTGETICQFPVEQDANVKDVAFLINQSFLKRGKKFSDGFNERHQVIMCPNATNPANKSCFPREETLCAI